MANAIPAIVTPEVLRWARELDSISIEDIARKIKVSPDRVQQWENGEAYPTLKQAKELAKQYRVPFVYFFLPDIPRKKKRLEKTDYRTFGNIGDQFNMTRELRWLLRDIEDRRDTMLLLYKEDNRVPCSFPIQIDKTASEQAIVEAVRNLLNLTIEKQRAFRKADKALAYCIHELEKYDVLVFQASKIDPKEMRGLSISYEEMPIIVLNRKDEPSSRLFTLCHELVHIVTRTSGICNNTSLQEATSQNEFELWCNRIAGQILVPIDQIVSHSATTQIKKFGFDDSYVNAMARDFAVSREVILHRLWDIKLIDEKFYYDTIHRYSEEYQAYKVNKKKDGFLPPAMDTGTQVGKLYARTVLSAFHTDLISPRDASGFLLNLKVQSFSKLEGWCF